MILPSSCSSSIPGSSRPTEVGAIGAFMAGLIGAAFGRLNWTGTFDALKSTISTCAMIFMVLIGAGIFGVFMTLSRVPQHVVAVVTDMDVNRWVVIIGIVVVYFMSACSWMRSLCFCSPCSSPSH